MKRFLILALLLTMSAATLSACANTFHGAGRDVENVGEKMARPGPG